jgi:hypothetical protein
MAAATVMAVMMVLRVMDILSTTVAFLYSATILGSDEAVAGRSFAAANTL